MRDVSRRSPGGAGVAQLCLARQFVLMDVSFPRFRDPPRWLRKGEAGDVTESFHIELCQTHGSGLTSAERRRLQSVQPPRSANANDVSGLHSHHPHSDAKFGA